MWHNLIIAFLLLINITLLNAADLKPLVHWDFNQITNNTIKDVSGNNDGIIIGGSTDNCIRPGLFGNAFYFDTGKHYIKINNSDALSLENDFTVEYVIKPEKVSSYRTIFWKGYRKAKPEAINYYFDIRDGKPEMKFKDKTGKWIVYACKPILKPGQWYHVIFTYKSGNVEIYVNGKKRRNSKYEDGKGKSLLPNKYDAYIGAGANSRSNAYYFTGLIDEIKIYKGRVINISDKYESQWRHRLNKNENRTEKLNKIRQHKEALRKKNLVAEYAGLFKRQAGKTDAPFTVTVLPAVKRLVKEPEFFKKIERLTRTAEISAARNEYEGFNIITLGNPTKSAKIDKVSVSDLISTNGASRIPAKNITFGYLKCVTSEKPDIPIDFIGAFPDVIMNGKSAYSTAKGDFTTVFVKVYTGKAQAGKYRGTVTLSGGGHTEKVTVNLRVYDFTLPEKGSLRTAFSFFEKFYKQWYDLKEIPAEKKMYIYNFLLSYRLAPNNIYTKEAEYPNLEYLEQIRNRTNFFTIRGCGNSKPVSPAILEKQVADCGKTIAKIKQAGLQNDMYYYSYDEIIGHLSPDKLAAAGQINSALQKAYPDLRMMQTSFPDPRIEKLFNVWVPIFSSFASQSKLKILNRLKKQGHEIWWYSADEPCHPYPNFFLDYPVFDCRIISTLSYMYKVKGVLYWCINREWLTNLKIRKQWPDAEWKPHIFHISRGTRKAKNGMGNLLYPGPDGTLLPSPRLENLRDGLEDYEYLKVLENAIERLNKSAIKEKDVLLKEANGLLHIPGNVAKSVDSWSSNPENLLEYRNKIGLTISKINSKLK